MALAVMSAACATWPDMCASLQGPIHYTVFTGMHMLLHSAVLAAAYRTCAGLGTRRALRSGLAAISGYYLLLVPLVQMAIGMKQVKQVRH